MKDKNSGFRQTIKTFVDFKPIAFSGTDVKITSFSMDAIFTWEKTSIQNTIQVVGDVTASDLNASCSVKTEFQSVRSFQQIQSQLHAQTEKVKQSLKLGKKESVGMLETYVKVRVGGKVVEVLKDAIPMSIDLEYLENLVSKDDCVLARGIKQLYLKWSDNPYNKEIPINYFFQPVGKTNWQSRWLQLENSGDHVDNSHVIETPYDQMVVCHHNNFQWVGGPACNCTNLDGHNAYLSPYSYFDYPEDIIALNKRVN
ncbi:MAG: hypothetical protein QNK23_13770 [Crocinitomicaceae bacterium]|nr:hypothetical protein [Crocinitomicaceae bacterium]